MNKGDRVGYKRLVDTIAAGGGDKKEKLKKKRTRGRVSQ